MSRNVEAPNIQQQLAGQDGRATLEHQRFLQNLVAAVKELQAGGTIENGVDGLTTEQVTLIAAITAAQWGYLAGMSAFGASLVDDADATAAQVTLGLVPGTNVQAYDAALQSLAGLTTAADKFPYTTASDTYAVGDITAAGRALIDDADAAAQRTTLGLTEAAVTTIETGEWTVTISDESGNDSPTTITGVYQRFGNVVEAGFSNLNNIDTTGMTGGDDVQISLPKDWAGYLTGNIVVASMSGTTPLVPYGETAGSTFKVATSQGSTPMTVSQMTDDAADILQCGLVFSMVAPAVSVTADSTTITADSTLITADAA